MRKLTLIVILLAIISLSVALYFLISHFSPRIPIAQETPTVSISPIETIKPTQTPTTTALCQTNQLTGSISSQGAAGNIYATLVLTNTGKTACEITLGNTVTAIFSADNIVLHQEQTVPPENFKLTPGSKVYSQVHYPNGPQCQNGVTPKLVTFAYDNNGITITFVPDAQTGKLTIQACSSQTEKTTVDIWPLSKTPITP
jgi:hypothetical protein